MTMFWKYSCVVDPGNIDDHAVPDDAADRPLIKAMIEFMYALDDHADTMVASSPRGE